MTDNKDLFYTMQIAGGSFPSGGFSQSWGLETYVAKGIVTDDQTFIEFTESYLESTITKCEEPLMCKAYELAINSDEGSLRELEELSCAIKVTKESRESSMRMGKAFIRIMADVLEDDFLTGLKKLLVSEGITYPVAYGAVCGRLRIPLEDAAKAFVFSTVNALVQSAVKLIPLGNTQAQKVLLDLYPVMEASARDGLKISIEEISNFCPGLDMASIAHEYLPTRLYMS